MKFLCNLGYSTLNAILGRQHNEPNWQIADAHGYLESNQQIGKVVVTI